MQEKIPTQFPKGKTAILVIHGIGEQNPFETLDSFARGVIQCYTESGMPVHPFHQIIERKDASGNPWIESYVRLQPREGESGTYLDIHEYYWAYITEEKISRTGVWLWVKRTLSATRKFYLNHPDERYSLDEQIRPRKPYPLFFILLFIPFFSFIMLPLTRLLQGVFAIVKMFSSNIIAEKISDWFAEAVDSIIINYLGDVAIYTTMDEKSKYYKIRQQILNESQALFEEMLASDAYEQIIVAGHSLGSVIAFDTLNRINIKSNLEHANTGILKKVKGLITFGSPLDKIAFFFQEVTKDKEHIRRQILDHLHSFKAKKFPLPKGTTPLHNTIDRHLDTIAWDNYFSHKDPVSGHLDFYSGVRNNELQLTSFWGKAHLDYWDEPKFYNDLRGKGYI